MMTIRTPSAELMSSSFLVFTNDVMMIDPLSSSFLVFTNDVMMIDPSDCMQDLTHDHSLCRVRTII